ncbi:glycosyltransferase [Hyphomicrobium sp.]|jgi:hopene-associated glycosyltransferase HpnB|uniref:glycosyltransferase n=1 Tax=Hyphomicrobium sp. TaxID=82 RepID=UPI002BF8DFCE|nr:glycosyltransferase [Hyphomicrobium sp.]HVZ04449.1 glycosyltransferase [Hyphomicrobium sp.]
MSVTDILAGLGFLAWLYLVLMHGGFWLTREREEDYHSSGDDPSRKWPGVVAVVPARNEADMLPQSLSSLAAQTYPGEFSIVLVDDQSSDGTAEVARRLAEEAGRNITIVSGQALPSGWTGKVWAMEQGIAAACAVINPPRYLLLTDADIGYEPDVLRSLVARSVSEQRVLTSVMAKLNCVSFAERALIPAFVFFFKMLYPFDRANRPNAATAAAAGGCMLIERAALERAGGIRAIRGALIDDCTLAKVMKGQGSIWLGMSERVLSLRLYPKVEDIRRMVARSAYAQLRYSPWLLAGTVFGMSLLYLAPPVLILTASYPASLFAAAAYGLMVLSFQPTLRFYHRSPLWGLALPLIAAVYLGFTLDSAYQHGAGRGGLWKGRVQAQAGKQ